MKKSWRDWFRFPKDKIELPPAEESPLWEVRDRVRKALDERKAAFRNWASPRRRHAPFTEVLRDIVPDIEKYVDPRDLEEVAPEDEGDVYFFGGVIQSLAYVTFPDGYRLAVKLESSWGDSCAVFYAEDNGRLLPLESALRLDGTPDAYWEAAVLWFEVAQFYRFGHANYEHMEMVKDLRSFLQNYSFSRHYSGEEIFKSLSDGERLQLYQMKFCPEVIPSADGCEVRFTTFGPFRGFSRVRLTITKKDAGISIAVDSLEQVHYRCPVMF